MELKKKKISATNFRYEPYENRKTCEIMSTTATHVCLYESGQNDERNQEKNAEICLTYLLDTIINIFQMTVDCIQAIAYSLYLKFFHAFLLFGAFCFFLLLLLLLFIFYSIFFVVVTY